MLRRHLLAAAAESADASSSNSSIVSHLYPQKLTCIDQPIAVDGWQDSSRSSLLGGLLAHSPRRRSCGLGRCCKQARPASNCRLPPFMWCNSLPPLLTAEAGASRLPPHTLPAAPGCSVLLARLLNGGLVQSVRTVRAAVQIPGACM